METVIKLKNVKKIFRYFKKDYKIILWLFTKKGHTKEFRVLNGIDIDIKKGEVVGILGKNGAGKSTLLKIISGIYFPTSGKVEVNGTIASLIELGAGFNKELTGRENIYLKGNLLGLSEKYMEEHIDSIIEFADIGEYMDMPLGTYSSGMSARLGFALAVNADPDILIIDEVFAVGDKNFQKKSRAKTEELLKSGKTVLFVSHSENLISEFCNRVIYLKDGLVDYDGPVEKGLALYHADNLNLARKPMIKFIEEEIINVENENYPSLRIRFEYGESAEDQFIKDRPLQDFNFFLAKFLPSKKEISEANFANIKVEKIDDNLVDIFIPIEDIIDEDYFTIAFNYQDKDEIYLPNYFEQNLVKEDKTYQVDIKNIENILALKLENEVIDNDKYV